MRIGLTVLGAVVVAVTARGLAQETPPVDVHVAVNRPGAAIPSTLFGVFFEDINFGADGGLYPERVKNRSFEFPDPLMGWRRAMIEGASGSFSAATDTPASTANPHYLRIVSTARRVRRQQRRVPRRRHREGRGLSRPPACPPRGVSGPSSLRVEFENARNLAIGSVTIPGVSSDWQAFTGTLTSEATERTRASASSPEAPARSTWTWFRCSRRTPGTTARTACAPTSSRCSRICIRASCASPAAASSKAATSTAAISGRRPSAISKSGSCSSTAGTTSSRTARRRIITSRSASASSSTSSCARTSAPNRCRFSTAAWPASSTPASWPARRSSTRTSRTRST